MKASKVSPFGEGGNWQLNACVGSNGGPYNFADYAYGYLALGNSVAEQIIKSDGHWGDVPIDVGIYPLLYLYRQGMELMLKHFIYDRQGVTRINGSHDLEKLWIESKQVLTELLGSYPDLDETLQKIEQFIKKLSELDPNGEVMRFPENLQRKTFLSDYSIINIEPIYESAKEMKILLDAMRSAINGISEA